MSRKIFGPKKSGAPNQVIIDLTRSPAKILFSHQVSLQALILGKILSKIKQLHEPKNFLAEKKRGSESGHMRPDPEPRNSFVFASTYSLNSDVRKDSKQIKAVA